MKRQIFYFNVILIISLFLITCSGPTEPQLNVQPTSFTFTENSNSSVLKISNSGSEDLAWEITDKPDWLEISLSSGKVTTGADEVIVTAHVNQEGGKYSGTISIESNGGNEGISISLDIGIWSNRESMPTAKWGHSSCVLDGKIYAVGGAEDTEGGAFTTLEVYDPILDTWTTKADMETARANFSTYVLNGKIYAVGGGNSFWWDPQNTIEEYDPVTDTWTHKANIPRARMGHTASLVDGKIYIIGGADQGETSFAEVDVYDPATNTWTTKADLPTPRFNLSAVVLNGKIYAMGGHIKPTFTGFNRVEEYNPMTDTWTIKASMIKSRRYFTACALNGKIYVFGGTLGHGSTLNLSSVEAYDPVINTWIEKTSMPSKLISASAVSLDGKIYISGGSPIYPPDVVKTMYEYVPGFDFLH